MIANTILAAGAFVSLVAAIPMAQPPFPKRDIVWETHTDVAMTTIPVTVTHWLEPGETPPTGDKQHWGHHGHGHGHGHGHNQPSAQPETTETAAPAPPSSYSPQSTSEAPAPSSYAPAPSSHEQSTEQPAPEPTSTWAPAPAPTTTEQATTPPAYTPVPQTSAAPEPSQPSSGGSNGLTGIAAAGRSHIGDLTYYDPGLGACGITSTASDHIVAVSESLFDTYSNGNPNPNDNPLCNQTVTITGENGSPYTATIVDRCTGCAEFDLDLSPDFFGKVVPTGDGRVPGVSWVFD